MFTIFLAAALSAQAMQPQQPASTMPATRASSEATGLSMEHARDIVCHDPSMIVKEGDTYWFFGTGNGVDSFFSKDLQTWERGPSLFEGQRDWVPDVVPGNRGHYWAPDVIKLGDTWHVYYSVSTFGRNTSAIAMATSKSLDPESPDYGWTDHGPVVTSERGKPFNAIDPAMLMDNDGRLWMSFGSFWGGLPLIELDPQTGMRLNPDEEPVIIAAKEPGGVNEIEAPGMDEHDGWYYLFVNWDFCCRGKDSTYNIRVGRSRSPEGPYVDREGKPLANGGGTLLAQSNGDLIGPGHASIFTDDDGQEYLSVHFYDGTTERGTPKLAIAPVSRDEDGWPMVADAMQAE